MDIRQREHTQITRPVAPPINLDTGRLDLRRAVGAAGFTLAALLVASGGGWIVVASTSGYTPNGFGVFLGGGITLVALAFGSVVVWISISEWTDHRARVADWHEQALWERQQSGGSERIEHVSEWELTTSNPAHVLLAALSVHLRRESGATTPWSVRQLYGPVFLAGQRVGGISKGNAELMGKQLATLGLIEGRAEREAGDWVPTSADELITLVVKNWR